MLVYGCLTLDLRTLDVETVRQYHRSYYRPDNLCLIIAGSMDPAELLAKLDKFEDKIVSKGELPPMER